MAKKQGTKARGHGGTEASAALVLAALTRAAKHVEKQPGAKDELAPGTRSCDLSIRICGDVIVGEPVAPGTPREVTDCSEVELLLAMIAEEFKHDATRLELAAAAGMRALAGIRKGQGAPATRLDDARTRLTAVRDDLARKHGLVKLAGSGGKKGAVTGLPGVEVKDGTAKGRPVVLSVEAAK